MPSDRAAGPDNLLAGRYRLGRVLGSGGGGIVREGEDTLLRRRVAIKEVRLPPLAAQAERDVIGERVLREARAAARLHHPGLVTVYDVIDADEHPWIVMEYVDGSSLADLIRETGRLPPLRVARIGISLAYALEAAHRAGVVHRDVKPGNVLIARDGQARLTDFGIAVTEGETTLTSTGMLLGSPAYIAPERARGASAGAAGDVWGLGATMFAAVEGDPPFAGNGAIATLAAVVEDRRRPFRYSGALRAVLTELLDSDPARRPSLAEARGRLREIAERYEAGTPDPPARPSAADTLETTRIDGGGTVAPIGPVGPVGPAPAAGAVVVPPPRATATAAPVDAADAADAADATDATARESEAGKAAAESDGTQDGSAPVTDHGLDVLTAEGPAPAPPAPRAGRPPAAAALGSSGASGDLPAGAGGDPGGGPGSGDPAARGSRSGGGRRSRTALLAASTVALLAAVAVTLSLVLTGGPSGSPRPAGAAAGGAPATTLATATTRPSSSSTATTAPPATPSATTTASVADANLSAAIPRTTAPAIPPAGFRTVRDASGWSAALPAGWKVAQRATGRQDFTAASGYPFLRIEGRSKAGPSAIAAWYGLQPSVRSTSPGYRLVSFRPADGGDGTVAAIWEFTYTSGGRTLHVLDFGVVRNGHGYALLWRAPENQWRGGLSLMRTIFATFRPGS